MRQVVASADGPRYAAVLARLQSRGRFGMRLGLGRTRALLRRLGDPQLGLRGVLIGGTNGKGSTHALVAAAVRRSGRRVGQTPKPHLHSYRERITVDGQPIAVGDFCTLLDEVLDADDAISARRGPSTEFEVLTAAAFLHFARLGVELGVVEVGIGGRLDATNVWQGGVTAITNVALDHTDVLGDTLVAIAREKAQIVKRGDSRAVTGASDEALGVIRRRARRVDVPLEVVAPWPVERMDPSGLAVRTPDGEVVTVGLLGRHQAANAAIAWSILDAFGDAGLATVGRDERAAAFAGARWPGRLELFRSAGPPVLVDGAHNPHGIAALGAAIEELLPQVSDGPPTLLIGVMANHWQEGMLEPLRSTIAATDAIATSVPGTRNSMPAERLAARWSTTARAIPDPNEAYALALEQATRAGGPLVICGSLYLVGYLRARLAGEQAGAAT